MISKMELERNDIVISMDVLKARLLDNILEKIDGKNCESLYMRIIAYAEVLSLLEDYTEGAEELK